MTRDDARESRRRREGPRIGATIAPYVFRYASPNKEFKLSPRFRRSSVENEDIAGALREALEKIEEGSGSAKSEIKSSVAGLAPSTSEVIAYVAFRQRRAFAESAPTFRMSVGMV